MSSEIDYIKDIVNSCFLPDLLKDLDSDLIESREFNEYHQMLQHQLPILYDLVQKNELWIFCNNRDTLETRCYLIILLCELTASETIYRHSNSHLVKNAERIIQLHLPKIRLQPHEQELQKILDYYQDRLKPECWKKYLGSLHGFFQFLKVWYANDVGNLMSSQWTTFCLSVGLRIQECHDPLYKKISIEIFHILLKHSNQEDIKTMNIHSVIYDSVFKMNYLMESVSGTNAIWNILNICLDYRSDLDSLSWNPTDDMIEILLRNIVLAPNSDIRICLWSHITKLCYRSSWNRKEIETSLISFDNLTICRQLCAENNSRASYRWAKSLLELFIAESDKLMGSVDICKHLLQEFLKCYMVCILPIPIEVVKVHLNTFFNKFCAILMQIIVTQKHDQGVIKIVHQFIGTFQWQLKRPNISETNVFTQFQEAFEKLLQPENNSCLCV